MSQEQREVVKVYETLGELSLETTGIKEVSRFIGTLDLTELKQEWYNEHIKKCQVSIGFMSQPELKREARLQVLEELKEKSSNASFARNGEVTIKQGYVLTSIIDELIKRETEK